MTTAPYPSYPSLEQFYDWRGGCPCFNTGYARGKEKLVSDLRNDPGHPVGSLIRPAFAAVDAYRADQRPPGEPDDYAKGYLDGQAYLAARLVH